MKTDLWSDRYFAALAEWTRTQQGNMRRCLSGNAKKFHAYASAGCWKTYFEQRTSVSEKVTRRRREHLFSTMEWEVENALKNKNAEFFRRFADELEAPYEVACEVRLWLFGMYAPTPESLSPRYTHAELMEAAEAKGIQIDERQLRRLMREMGFTFKHSKQ